MAAGYFYGVTRSRSGTWARRVGVCLAMLGLAATTSAPALAESGMPDVPVASVPDLADVATAILEDTSLPELDPATAAGILPITLPAGPAQTTAAEPALVGAPLPMIVRQAIRVGRSAVLASRIAASMASGSCPSMRVVAQP